MVSAVRVLKPSTDTTAPLHEGMVNVVPSLIWHQSVQPPLFTLPGLVVKSHFTSMALPLTVACVT